MNILNLACLININKLIYSIDTPTSTFRNYRIRNLNSRNEISRSLRLAANLKPETKWIQGSD